MGHLAESSARGQKLLESGQWKYVTEPTAPPAIPAPTNAYPAAPNQYLRAPLPADQWQDPDAQRQFHAPAIPQTRISPLPANTSPVAGAQAASQAIQLIQSTPAAASGVTSVGLTAPNALFTTPVLGSPVTSAGTLALALANEPINTVFAGAPSTAGVVNVDTKTTTAGVQGVSDGGPFSASLSVSKANELALTFVYPESTLTPAAGFTTVANLGSPGAYIGSLVTTGAGTVTAAGKIGFANGQEWVQMLLAFTNTGSTPPTIRQVGSLSALNQGLNTGNPFAAAVLASSSIVVFAYSKSIGGATPSAPAVFTITDNQGGGTYVELLNAFNSTTLVHNESVFAQCFATPSVTAGVLTASVTSTLNGALGWSQANTIFLEIVGLGNPILTPTFRPLVAADIPNIDASSITTGKLALARGGTNADLSATGGTSQVLKQTSAGAAITVAQLAASDLSNGTTGSGAVVLAASPTITGTAALASETLSGKITNYNGIATVSNGVPAEYATVDLTAQAAAIGATTLYTPTATGMFRISAYLKVTTVDATSSTLGAVTITYTDGTDSVAQSAVMQMANELGASVTSNSGNTTAAKLIGSTEIWALTGVAIQYAVAYASNIAGTMKYEVHLKCEAL